MYSEKLQYILNDLSESEIKLSTVENVSSICQQLDVKENLSSDFIGIYGDIIKTLLEKFQSIKGQKTKYEALILDIYHNGKNRLKSIADDTSHSTELRIASFKALLNLLPSYVNFLSEKAYFPSHQYAEIIELIVVTKGEVSFFIDTLKEFLTYDDMIINIWKALEIAISKINDLKPNNVENVLHLIELTEKPKDKPQQEYDVIGPRQYYCGVKVGVLKPKDLKVCVQHIWEQLSVAEVPLKTKRLLLLTLLEKMMPRMDKPIFLTDYFMNALHCGGPISLLALQGIFILIQKYNINYPNIYEKLYDMFSAEIFGTYYKTRFFYLADMFLSSLHLPEALVAGFVKRMARLCLVAPPTDILILLAMITNLIIRHPGLNRLLTNTGKDHFETDPYDASTRDPSLSNALESSLWEVKLLQNHIIPTVSAAATFVDKPLSTVERDLSALLESDTSQIFQKECKRRVKDVPIAFEDPSLMSKEKGFMLWNFKK